MSSGNNSYLKLAGNLIKGDLVDINAELKLGRERKGGILWKVLTHLICYANNEVFNGGYTKKLAKQFRADVMSETGLSEKQASKYTESISAALGVRGIRKGIRSLDGLTAAAASGLKTVEELLKTMEIETFNQFMAAVRIEPTPVERAAKVLYKLTMDRREKAMELAKEMDKNEGADSED